jgi:hypothetical protein
MFRARPRQLRRLLALRGAPPPTAPDGWPAAGQTRGSGGQPPVAACPGQASPGVPGRSAARESVSRPAHPARPADDPWMDIPGRFFPEPGNLVPAADVALAPGEPAAAGGADGFPEGISALPACALSGGPRRPRRLVYRDGTVVDCRPVGGGPVWTGIAAGIIPAAGNLAPGWLQVVRRDGDDLLAVHPALLSPWSVNPLAGLSYRQRVRFTAFDAAEAAGLDAAGLPATFVDQGDSILLAHPCSGQPVTREVLDAHTTGGAAVIICSVDSSGRTFIREHPARDALNVMIPSHHPAEDGPQGPCLFAPA